jgi:hypothetical protein
VRRVSILPWSIALGPALAVSAAAQLPLTPADAEKINPAFDSTSPRSLKCDIEKWETSLDFALRFQAGYLVRCRLGVFEGKATAVATKDTEVREGLHLCVISFVILRVLRG